MPAAPPMMARPAPTAPPSQPRPLLGSRALSAASCANASDGIASGIGSSRYGAQLIVEADGREAAIEKATGEFTRAAAQAGLLPAPVVRTEAISEDEDAAG